MEDVRYSILISMVRMAVVQPTSTYQHPMSTLITTPQGYLKLGTTLPKLNPSDAWTAILDTDTPECQLNRVVKRYIDPNEPCFITNKSFSLNQEVHWISDVENDNEERRFMVMRYLALQGYLTLDFTFDHSTNIVNLDPVLFRTMVQYELFAVTLSHATLDKFTALAKEENEIIKARVKSGSDHIRNLQILPSTDTAEYELVVLHSKYFLPENTHLTRYPDPDGPDQTSPKDYQLDANGVLREVPATKDSPRFPSFRFATSNSRRHKWGKLNPYTVLLSAELRFQRYKEAPDAPQLNSEYESLIAKTIELVDLLTWEGEKGGTANLLFGEPGLDIEQALKRKCFRLKAGQRDPFMGGGFPEGMCDVNTLWDPVEAPSLTEREQVLLDALEGNA